MADNFNLTPFDLQDVGGQLLQAIIAGEQSRRQDELQKMQQKQQDRENELQSLQILSSIFGPEAGLEAAQRTPSVAGLIPPGAQTPFQQATAGLTPEQTQMFRRRQVLGTSLPPERLQEAEEIQTGLRQRPPSTFEKLGFLLSNFGTTPEARKLGAEMGLQVPGKPTIAERELQLKSREIAARATELLATKFVKAPNVTDEEFSKAMERAQKTFNTSGFILSEDLAKMQTTDVALQNAINALKPSARSEIALKTLGVLSDLAKSRKGRLSREQKQLFEDMLSIMLSDPAFGTPVSEALGPSTKPKGEAASGTIVSGLSNLFGAMLEPVTKASDLAALMSANLLDTDVEELRRAARGEPIGGGAAAAPAAPETQRLGPLQSERAKAIPEDKRKRISTVINRLGALGTESSLLNQEELELVEFALDPKRAKDFEETIRQLEFALQEEESLAKSRR